MGKGNDNFNNIIAEQSKNEQRWKTMDEERIYHFMDQGFQDLLDSLGKNIQGVKGAKYPTYIDKIFKNPSVCKFILEACINSKKELKELQKEYKDKKDSHDSEYIRLVGLRHLIAMGYKFVSSNQEIDMDKKLKIELLSNAFWYVDKDRIKIAKKFNLEEDEDAEAEGLTDMVAKQMAIHAYIGADHARFLVKYIDASSKSDKQKFKLFKEIVDDWKKVMGASFTVISNQNFIDFLFKEFSNGKKKFRKKVLKAYAKQFKKVEKRNFHLESDLFYKNNKKIIRKLIKEDIGFHKALTPIKDQVKIKKK